MTDQPTATFPEPVTLLLDFQSAIAFAEKYTDLHPCDPKSPCHYAWGRVKEVYLEYEVNYEAGRDVTMEAAIIASNIRLLIEKAATA